MSQSLGHDAACEWFERYCDQTGLDWEYEPDLGTQTKPDYLVRRGSQQAVCELKSFDADASWMVQRGGPGFQVNDGSHSLRRIRQQIRSGARNLKPLAGRGLPLVIVLADPLGSNVLLSQSLYAVYGDPLAQVGPGEDGKPQWTDFATRNGKLRNDHRYVSAVVVLTENSRAQQALSQHQTVNNSEADFMEELRRKFSEVRVGGDKRSICATIIDAPSQSAVRLPEGLLSGKLDMRYRLDLANGRVVRGPAVS